MAQPFHIRPWLRPPYTALMDASAEYDLSQDHQGTSGSVPSLLPLFFFDVCNESGFHSATSERNISSLAFWPQLFFQWLAQQGNSEIPNLYAVHELGKPSAQI